MRRVIHLINMMFDEMNIKSMTQTGMILIRKRKNKLIRENWSKAAIPSGEFRCMKMLAFFVVLLSFVALTFGDTLLHPHDASQEFVSFNDSKYDSFLKSTRLRNPSFEETLEEDELKNGGNGSYSFSFEVEIVKFLFDQMEEWENLHCFVVVCMMVMVMATIVAIGYIWLRIGFVKTDKSVDIQCQLKLVQCSDEPETPPVPWEVASRLILCQRHGHNGVNSAPIGGGYISWEWHKGKLCVYLSSHVVSPPPQAENVYGDVFVSTYRGAQKKLTPTFVSNLDKKIRVSEHRLLRDGRPINAVGYSGSVLTGNRGNYYVIHDADEQGRLIERDLEKQPGEPFEFVANCRYCHDEAGTSYDIGVASDREATEAIMEVDEETSIEVEDALAAPRRHVNSISDLAIEMPSLPEYDGVARTEEWQDYWGTKYVKYEHGNFTYLRCRDTPLYAIHTYNNGNLQELYPDVGTTLSTVTIACSSQQTDCIYTHADSGRGYKPAGRQIFFMRQDRELYVMNCLVIKTAERLTSGQCLYHWTRGWNPYQKDNVRVAGVVTIARRIDNYWYSAIMNGSADIYTFKVDGAQVYKTDYIRNREVCENNTSIKYFEEVNFRNNKMTRLLSRDRKVVATWTIDNSLDYQPNDWEYCAIETIKFSPFIRGVPDHLANSISCKGGVTLWMRSVEELLASGPDVMPSPIAPMVCFSTSSRLTENVCRINVEVAHDASVREIGNVISVRAPSGSLLEMAGRINRYLWSSGFEVLTYTGDLLALTRDSRREIGVLFGGCHAATTPCLWFIHNDHNVLNELKAWMISRDALLEGAMIGSSELVIHPDWRVGAARLAPSIKADATMKSLAAWRSVQSMEVRELAFDRDRVACSVTSPEEICEVQPGDYWLGEVISAVSAGCCFGDNESMVSSYHVTYGNDVTLTRAGMTYTWEKIFHASEAEDLVTYGDRSFKMVRAEKGEILCVVCPSRRVGQYLLVEDTQSNYGNRSEAMFYELRPVEIDPTYNFIRASRWRGVPGMSGCPIFNAKGEIVSIYGLGKIETRTIGSTRHIIAGADVTALTTLAPDISVDAIPDNYFKTAVVDLLNNPLAGENTYYLLEAPTGSGKTMSFTMNLMKAISAGKNVFLLQPTVAAVKAAYSRICELLDVSYSGASSYSVEYIVGQRHEDSTERSGHGDRRLTILSYGAAMRRIEQIENNASYLLLDEIHCRSDPTVVAGDLQFTRRGTRYKCVHLTATVLTRHKAQKLADGLDILGTRYEIKDNIKIEPMQKGDACNGEWFVIPAGTIGVKLDGFKKGFKIPMAVLETGRVIFFLSTRNDCEKLVTYASRQCGGTRQYVSIHGGTTFNIGELANDCWCFCTDIVGQAVTVPGCRVVIDLLEEMKPNTILMCSNDGLMYRHELRRRRIGVSTSKQRKGRTGRTNVGWYITPRGVSPLTDYPVDKRTAALAMLQLEAERRLNWQTISDHHDLQLVKTMEELRWLLPSEVTKLEVWSRAWRHLSKDSRVSFGPGKRAISNSMSRKLDLIKDANGDTLYLYLSPLISDEIILATSSQHDRSRTADTSSEIDWYSMYLDFAYKCPTENVRAEVLMDLNISVQSFLEETSLDSEVSFELFNRIIERPRLTNEVMHSNIGLVGGTVVALGCTAVLLSTAYNLTVRNASRHVSRVYPFRKSFCASHCKFLADLGGLHVDGVDIAQTFSERAMAALVRRKDQFVEWTKSAGFPISETQHSVGLPLVSSIYETAKMFLATKWALIPATYHIGAFPSSGAVMGATWVGSAFIKLEKILGRSIAVALLAILNGMLAFFTTTPLAIAACVAQVIGFVMRGLTSGSLVDYDAFGSPIKSGDRAWDLIFGMTGGVGAALLIKNQLLVASQLLMPGSAISAATAATLGVGAGRSVLFGASGNAVALLKQIYMLFTRVQDGNMPWSSLGGAMTALMQTMTLDVTTGILCTVIAVGLLAIRTGLKTAKFQAGVSSKSVRQPDGTNAYVEDFFGSFDKFAMNTLCVGAILASPSSMFSIAIAWIGYFPPLNSKNAIQTHP